LNGDVLGAFVCMKKSPQLMDCLANIYIITDDLPFVKPLEHLFYRRYFAVLQGGAGG